MIAKKTKALILQNEQATDGRRWEIACEKRKDTLDYTSIDITRHDWLEQINDFRPDIILTKPSGLSSFFKNLYDERLAILSRNLGYFCFPTLEEVLIYENKRYLSYWLKAHGLPHPKTYVFYSKKEAIHFLDTIRISLVAKTNIGASGSGITLLNTHKQAKKYLEEIFSGNGISRRSGPNLEKGGLIMRGASYIFHPGRIKHKFRRYKTTGEDKQKGFLILQEYIKHDYEWRVVRMGDSFFAHKKVKEGDKASGTLVKEYGPPPADLLTFVEKITSRFGFYSQAIDLFESEGRYLINEMQCIFGQSDPYQMLIENKRGRYIFDNNQWIFEEGDFNTNESYDLRLEAALKLYDSKL